MEGIEQDRPELHQEANQQGVLMEIDDDDDDQNEPVEHRACLNCKIIKSFSEFYHEGCPNCEKFMKFKNCIERVVHCTSLEFFGLRVMFQSFNRWRARIIPVAYFAPGLYAREVVGAMQIRFIFQLLSDDDNDAYGQHCA